MSLVSIVKLVLAVTTLEFYNWEFPQIRNSPVGRIFFFFRCRDCSIFCVRRRLFKQNLKLEVTAHLRSQVTYFIISLTRFGKLPYPRVGVDWLIGGGLPLLSDRSLAPSLGVAQRLRFSPCSLPGCGIAAPVRCITAEVLVL
jgi:hypothetical protein